MSHGAQALPNRIGATLKSAAKVRGARWIRVVRQIDRELEPVSSAPVTDDELRDGLCCIALIEETQLRIMDDLHSLPLGTDAAIYILTINGDEGQELARDKLRLRVPRAEPTEITTHSGPAPGSKDWEMTAEARPSAAVMQTAMLRQQYRHNEALAGSIVKSYAGTLEKTTGLVGTLADALNKSLEARANDAEKFISVARHERVLVAEARSEELRGEAMKTAANTLAEWLPVALHKIARKYGLSGDDAIDPMIEKMVLSFKPDQLDGLATVLSPVQLQMLGDLWCQVKDRAEARKKKAAEGKPKPDASKLPANAEASGANGANGSTAAP